MAETTETEKKEKKEIKKDRGLIPEEGSVEYTFHFKKYHAVIIAAFFLRHYLQTRTSLPDLLSTRLEISTPITSFKRLKEGLFLYEHGVPPYNGGVCHQAPLLLAFFSMMPSSEYAISLIFSLADVFSAYYLRSLSSDSRYERGIAAKFLFNPLTLATCLGRSSSSFSNLAVLASIAHGHQGLGASAMVELAMASYLSLYPALLLVPLMMLCRQCQPTISYVKLTSIFVSALSALLLLSYALVGSWDFLTSTYGVILLLPDLTPNVGLWWYFFIEMFDSFRSFFLVVFQLHLLIYVLPLILRLHRNPLAIITTLTGIISIFKSYPSVSDLALYLGLLSLHTPIFSRMRYVFLSFAMLAYAALLGPAFLHLWMYAGSGNANFFYAITLVYNLAQIILVADGLYAMLKLDWEENEGKDQLASGGEVVQI